ncbi:MAG: aminoglycoside phosphotransferase family protein [Methyloceanibacter sp.]
MSLFEPWLARWDLVPDGKPIATYSSNLLPVVHRGAPAMLKVPFEEEERWGWLLMTWWNDDGAARVLARDGHVLLLERAMGSRSLAAMAESGRDNDASRIICQVAGRLHAPRGALPNELIPLQEWFAALAPAVATHGGILRAAAKTARELLSSPENIVPLHADLHHGNVLDFGARGWLAIDPKRVIGERGFDFANIFCNPDAAIVLKPGRLERQATVIAAAANLHRNRLLKWILTSSGLSAAWIMGDGDYPAMELAVAEIAAAELERSGG